MLIAEPHISTCPDASAQPTRAASDRQFPHADAEWSAIGAVLIELVERAGSMERFVEIARAMGVPVVEASR